MIKYLPKLYPNETAYSYLSRLFCHSGFITSVGFSKEVLVRDKAQVNYEFINELNPSFKKLLLSHISYEELLLNHTLFKYHIRFLDNDKKKEAYDYAMTNKSLLFHKLPVPLNKNYYLRYCPLCVEEDRVEYGESYYHIEHLFPFINICPNHCCRLIDTKVKINRELNKTFIPLEEVINDLKIEIRNELDINVVVAKYIHNLYMQPFKYDVEGSVGKFLTAKLDPKYLSIRYKRKDLESLYEDFKNYYKNLEEFDISKNRLARIYSGTSRNTYDICLVALFEGISINDLIINKIDDSDEIDDEVKNYYEKGYNYSEIASKVGISKETVRRIIIGRDYNCGWSRCIKGKSRCDWNKLDNKYCSRFKKEFKGCKVITKKLVAESFGIKDKKLRKFPKLSNMILECKKSML